MDGRDSAPPEADGRFEASGSNQTGMRAHNERLVLTMLRQRGPLPKAEIARVTGLSAQTVSVIMRALESDGLLEKGEKLRGKVGQPSVPLALAADGAYFLGLKVGRRSAELSLVNFVGDELGHVSKPYPFPTPDVTLDFVWSAVETLCAELAPDQRARIAGLGVASPFFLWEWAATIGVDASKMASWKAFDLRAELDAAFDFPVFLGNDATSACGAELVFGTAETPPDFLYIYIGYFVGGGIVLNGALYPGRTGNAGALGPFPVSAAGAPYAQVVAQASLIGLERRVAEEGGDVEQIVSQQDHWDIAPHIIETWLNDAATALAHVIIGSVSILDFTTVLVDGNMPQDLRDQVIERISSKLEATPLSGLDAPQIKAGSLGPRARRLGAASLPLARRFLLETA